MFSAVFLCWLIATLVTLGWWELRGDSCWKCGQETGLCQHTKYDEPDDPHGGRDPWNLPPRK